MSDEGTRQDVVPPDYAAGAGLPWWAKVASKLAIAALRVPPALLRRAGVNRHSFVAESESRVLHEPCTRAGEFANRQGRPPRGVLELGPGRLVVRAPAYAALGCAPVWFADVEDDAPGDPAAYARVAELARGMGLPAPVLDNLPDKAAALAACGARQLIGGTEVLAAIPDGSVELIVSDVVLEHVRRDALPGLLAELRRVAAPNCLGVHAVDFHDHVGGALNTLRFPPRFWEGPLVARSGLYVNRLGLSEILAAFEKAGFATRLRDVRRWPAPPAGAGAAHPSLARRAEDELIAFARIEALPV
ncbi:hypothetical protein [Muricoccus aerilatus]|uniref:hypothetical protein n=1 Tax=Muricoccus aerilatus TaxID=452982 RepID=UPI00069353B2|nr:hypothetical protein [Roseomonas aerilata]